MKLEPQSLTCPICAHAFKSSLVVDYQIGEKESDFCPRYLDGNPLPEMIHLCPSCGYVAFEPDFRSIKDGERIEEIRRVLKGFDYEKGTFLSGPERYRRAAVLAIYLGKSNAEIANLYLQATWCSRLDGEPEEAERRARKKAVEYFEKALENEEFTDEDKPVVLYLVGELCRRLGKSTEALLMFSKLDNYENVDEWLSEWRDRQRKLISDESSD